MLEKYLMPLISENKIFKRVLVGSAWMIGGSVIPKVFTLITFVFVARILGQDLYGKLSILRSTITMFSVFASFGIGLTASRYVAQYRDIDKRKTVEVYKVSTFFSTVLGILIAFLLFVLANYTSNRIFDSADLSISLKIGSLVLLFATLNESQNGTLSGLEDFRSISINTFISTIIQCISIIVLAYLYGLNGVIVGFGFGNLVLWIINIRSIGKKGIYYNLIKLKSVNNEVWMLLWKYAFPAAVSGIMVLPVLWWSKSFLVKHSNFSDLAIYDVAEQWSSVVMFLPAILGRIFLPILSNTYVAGSFKQYFNIVKMNILINVSIGFICSLIIALLSKYIVHTYGKGFDNTIPLLWMLCAIIFSIAASIVGQIIASSGNMWIGFFLNLCWAFVLICSTIFFVGNMRLGSSGLAISLTISYIIHFVISSVYAYVYLKHKNK